MCRITVVPFLTVFMLLVRVGSAQTGEPALQAAFDKFSIAWTIRDADAWATLIADNGFVKHPDGRVHGKLDEIEHIRSGTSRMSPRSEGDDRIRFDLGGKIAVRRYVAESGLVTEFWRRTPDGAWVLENHWDGFGQKSVLDHFVKR